MQKYQRAYETADEAIILEKECKNIKAFYRRAQAAIECYKIDQARRDITRLE